MTLIYDNLCGVCRAWVRWLQDRIEPNTIEYLPCESSERERRFPEINADGCRSEVKLILPDNRIIGGADVILHLLRYLHGFGWLCAVFRLKPIRTLAKLFYRRFAANRFLVSRILNAYLGDRDKSQIWYR